MPVEVLCIGHAAYDINMYLSEYPAENSKAETLDNLECGGGPAANAACLLSQWGIKTAFAGVVGNDLYGWKIDYEFRTARVDRKLLEFRDGHATPLSIILVNTKSASRTVINRKSETSPYHPDPERLAKMRPMYLLFDGHELEASLDALKAFPDAVSVLDAGSLRPGTKALASKVDYLIASERFACQVSGLASLNSDEECAVALEALLSISPGTVAITLGERGLVFVHEDRLARLPAFEAEAVDTTGAGDVFHGAFVYGLITNMDFQGCLSLGSTAAAASITKRGGRTSIPTIEELQQFIATSPERREA